MSVDKFAAIGMLASTEPGRFADVGAIDATSLPSFSHFPGSDFIYTNFRRGRENVTMTCLAFFAIFNSLSLSWEGILIFWRDDVAKESETSKEN